LLRFVSSSTFALPLVSLPHQYHMWPLNLAIVLLNAFVGFGHFLEWSPNFIDSFLDFFLSMSYVLLPFPFLPSSTVTFSLRLSTSTQVSRPMPQSCQQQSWYCTHLFGIQCNGIENFIFHPSCRDLHVPTPIFQESLCSKNTGNQLSLKQG
jgi:hypothetical protein